LNVGRIWTVSQEPSEAKPDGRQANTLGFAIAIGVGVGVALGVAMDNIGVGIALGAGDGVIFGAAFGQRRKPEDDANSG
jgi:hypothetical protein